MNHFIAATWYLVGSFDPVSSWVKEYSMRKEDADLNYRYGNLFRKVKPGCVETRGRPLADVDMYGCCKISFMPTSRGGGLVWDVHILETMLRAEASAGIKLSTVHTNPEPG